MSKNIQKWLDRFLNRMTDPQYERLVDRYGIVYWLKTVTHEEWGVTYLHLLYRGRGVGCGGGSNVVNLQWELPDRLYLDDICLSEKWRKVGLGSQLLCRVITLAKRQGVRSIQGDITQEGIDDTPGLLNWYQRHGFRVEPPKRERYVHSIVLDLL